MPASPEAIRQVAAVLEPFHRNQDRLGVLLALCVGRLMLKEMHGNEAWRDSFPTDKIRHVADWLKAAVANDAEWLRNVDTQGRPKKLMKFGSFDRVMKDADRSMRIESQKLSGVKVTAADETLVAELVDGMYLVRLETPAALDRESAEMQHCIGNGGYDDLLEDGSSLFLSLRDHHGKAHATLEIDLEENRLEQLQGKQNKAPARKYVEALAPFLKSNRYKTDLRACDIGHVIDIHGRWHPIGNLPDNLTVQGDLHLTRVDIKRLPNGLRVGGCLYLMGSTIECLPPGLRVGKTLFIGNTLLTHLPEDIHVGGRISICTVSTGDSPIRYIPDIIDDQMRIMTSAGSLTAARFREHHPRHVSETMAFPTP